MLYSALSYLQYTAPGRVAQRIATSCKLGTRCEVCEAVQEFESTVCCDETCRSIF